MTALALVGACSNVIGISDYEIDPKLDNVGGTEPIGAGGSDTGGGMGGATQAECQSADDCDDTIDCTTDTCSAATGSCVHAPKDTLCDTSMCEKCEMGIGCVVGSMTTTQLLLDPDFDEETGDWDETMSDGANLTTAAGAQSGMTVAQFGPAAKDAMEQQYSDLLQYVTIPARTVGLTLKGYYKLTPGVKKPVDDYVVAAFYADGKVQPATQFHSFAGNSTAQTAWKAFTYDATPKSDVALMAGKDFTFDLVAHVWDTVIQLDTLELNATVCE
jgi:hypothetical protein